MAKLKLFTRQAGYVPHDPAGRAPIRCVLVGGRPEYGNVARLPEKLWEEWGIAVIAHLPPSVKSAPQAAAFDADIAIVLVDMVSHMLSEWSKSLDVEHNVYVPAGWSKVAEALKKCGVTPVPGNAYSKPKKEPVPSTPTWKDALLRAPTVSEPAQAAPTRAPAPEVPMAKPQIQPPEGQQAPGNDPVTIDSPPPLSEVLAELKRAMQEEGVQKITATLMRDGTLTVELRKVVVTTESLEV